jgi:hypothetical protein
MVHAGAVELPESLVLSQFPRGHRARGPTKRAIYLNPVLRGIRTTTRSGAAQGASDDKEGFNAINGYSVLFKCRDECCDAWGGPISRPGMLGCNAPIGVQKRGWKLP